MYSTNYNQLQQPSERDDCLLGAIIHHSGVEFGAWAEVYGAVAGGDGAKCFCHFCCSVVLILITLLLLLLLSFNHPSDRVCMEFRCKIYF